VSRLLWLGIRPRGQLHGQQIVGGPDAHRKQKEQQPG
jgi:hypothetical protein